MIKLINISKYYHDGNTVTMGLQHVSASFEMGEFVAITGESGSGKSTLLNVISGMDTYEDGEMYLGNEETSYFEESDWEYYRKHYIGFIFQNYNLIDSYTVLENVEVPLIMQGIDSKTRKKKAKEILEKVGLSGRIKHKAIRLSGGEKQRLAIARALAKNPKIIVADEPTGNLDSETGKQIMELLASISKDRLVLMVTHNYEEAQNYVTRKIKLYDGEIVEDRIIKKHNEVEEVVENKNIKKDDEKNSFKKTWILSFYNLKNQPKRTTLLLLISLISCFFVFLASSIYTSMATENGAGMYNSYFSNTYKERVEVVKKDGGNISDEDINEIEAIKGVSEVIDYSVILDYTFNFYFDDNYYNCYIFNADSITEDDLMLGTLPQNKNEVVIGASFSEKQIKDYPSSILDASLFYAYNYDLKIVGVTYVSSSEDKRIYVNDELFKEASILCYAYNYASNVTVELTTPTEVLNYSYVEYDNTITDDKLHIFYFDSSITNVKFNDKEVEFVIHESAIDSKISFGDAFIEKYLYNGREQVTVNLSNYNQLASVSTKLKALGYYYVSPYVSSTSYDIVFLLEILALITTIPIFLITFFATYLVIKIILLSKKRDYTILRTVGIDNKIIKNMNKLELLISYNVSFLILIILFILFKSLRIDAISVYLDVITFKKAIIIYIISIVFAMFISLRFNRLLIKRSLLSTLRQGE